MSKRQLKRIANALERIADVLEKRLRIETKYIFTPFTPQKITTTYKTGHNTDPNVVHPSVTTASSGTAFINSGDAE